VSADIPGAHDTYAIKILQGLGLDDPTRIAAVEPS